MQPPDYQRHLARYAVLYVDDEPDNVLVFRANLHAEFNVMTAASGREALAVMEEHDVALLLTDNRMPEMTGVELCERVGQLHPNVRRVLITAFSDQRTAIDAINRGGVHAFLVKPWELDDVRRVIRSNLERVHLERVVVALRNAITLKERALAASGMHGHVMHDLKGATQKLLLVCRRLEQHLLSPGAIDDGRVEKAQEAVKSLRRTVDHLIAIHSDEAQSPQPAAEPFRLIEAIDSARAITGLEQSGAARVKVRCSPDVQVYADRVAVTRILVNLLNNASEALETTRVAGRRGRVAIDVHCERDQIRIHVADNGPGIPAEQRERLFEEGFTTKQHRGGSGIGLASSRHLAEVNRGSLDLIASDEPGARFEITLPSGDAVVPLVTAPGA